MGLITWDILNCIFAFSKKCNYEIEVFICFAYLYC